MKILKYTCSCFLFLGLITTVYAQKDSIAQLNGIIKLKAAEIDLRTSEQLYYTVIEVSLPEGLAIERVTASSIVKVENKWRETFSFFEAEGGTSKNIQKFYIRGNILRFEMGLLPDKYKIRAVLYETKTKRYNVKLKKTIIKTESQ